MKKTEEISAASLLSRIRKNLMEASGEPEEEVIKPEIETKVNTQEEQDPSDTILIRDLFGEDAAKGEEASTVDLIDRKHGQMENEAPDSDSDMELPPPPPTELGPQMPADIMEDDPLDPNDPFAGRNEYDLLSIFGMKDVGDEDEEPEKEDTDSAAEKEELPPQNFLEYEDRSQLPIIKKRFMEEYRQGKLRVAAAFVMLFLCVLIEDVFQLFKNQPPLFSSQLYPDVFLLWGIQGWLLLTALLFKKITNGAMALFHARPDHDSLLFLYAVIDLAYLIYLIAAGAPAGLMLYNAPMAVMAILFCIGDQLALERELLSFTIAADKHEKYVIDTISSEDSAPERAELMDFIEEKTKFLRVTKPQKVTGFFRRFRLYRQSSGSMLICIPLIVLVLTLMATIGYFSMQNWEDAMRSAMLSLGLAVPSFMCLSDIYPAYRMSRKLYAHKTAVIGQRAISEYTAPSVMMMRDTDLFPSSKMQLVTVRTYGKTQMDRVLHDAAAILKPLGGPLSGLLSRATADLALTSDVDYIRIEDDGIECAVENRHVYIGRYDYIKRKGFSLYREVPVEETTSSAALYMVENDRISAMLLVRYELSDTIEAQLNDLRRAGVGVCVRTFDPTLNTDRVSAFLDSEMIALRVIKCRTPEQRMTGVWESDSGIITSGKPKELFSALAATERCRSASRAMRVLGIFAAILSVLLSYIVIQFFGTLPSWVAVVYQGFWTTVLLLLAGLFG